MSDFKGWSEDEVNFLIANYKNYKYREIAVFLNKTLNQVSWVAKRLNLKKAPDVKYWSDEEVAYLKELYAKGLSLKEIVVKFNEVFTRSRLAITNKANELDIATPPEKRDRGDINFFEIIDTQEKAYWLGFIYTDGYISKSGNGLGLGIELAECDIGHLYKFNKIFNNYYKVSTRTRSKDSLDIHNKVEPRGMTSTICQIRIYSKKVVADLIDKNVVVNKTYRSNYPILENDEMFIHFLRGVMDGDGSYVIRRLKNIDLLRASLSNSNEEFLKYIAKRLEAFNIYCGVYKEKDRKWNFKLQTKDIKSAALLIDLLYNNATIYLDRKFDKVNEIKELAVYKRNFIDD